MTNRAVRVGGAVRGRETSAFIHDTPFFFLSTKSWNETSIGVLKIVFENFVQWLTKGGNI